MMTHRFGRLRLVGALLLVAATLGCRIGPDRALAGSASQIIFHGFDRPPRVRFGSYPSSNIGTFFLGPNLGTHGYNFRFTEKNGVVYTCRGGHIDIIHARIAADWTAYLVAQTYRHLMDGDRSFSCKLAVDRSRNYLTFTYPDHWDQLSRIDQMEIAREVAFAVGPYVAYTMTTWHEILTWYGFKCVGPFPEFPSAFSWEDSYSNLLGTIVAVRALQDTQHNYNDAVKMALDEEMQKLGILPAREARRATESVRGEWFTGNIIFAVDMKKRNFDIGLRDGYITPTLLPEVAGCPSAEPLRYPVPTLDVLWQHGFSLTLEIEPHEWERRKILRVVHGDQQNKRVNPREHFPVIMDDIRQQAVARYGPEYGPDYDDSLQVSTAR